MLNDSNNKSDVNDGNYADKNDYLYMKKSRFLLLQFESGFGDGCVRDVKITLLLIVVIRNIQVNNKLHVPMKKQEPFRAAVFQCHLLTQ